MNFCRNKKVILVLIFILAGVLMFQMVEAKPLKEIIETDQLDRLAETGLPAGETSPLDVIVRVIQLLLGTMGVLFLAIIIIAGFRWMTSDGNQETIEKAKKSIQAAFIGLAVVFFSYGITAFLFNVILNTK